MKGILTLKNPILIDGKQMSKLEYDTNEITGVLFAEADSRKMRANGSKGGNLSGAAELDYGLHLYLGYAAVIAVNPAIDFSDMERMKGSDVMEVMSVGRNFIMKREDSSQASESDEQSGTTPEPSTQASATSKKSD